MSRLRRTLRLLARHLAVTALSLVLVAGAGVLGLAAWHPRLVLALGYWRPPDRYVVPVAGIRAADLRSTWGAPRSGGRRHAGVDIFAKPGTPVVSATDGVVWSVGTNSLGGRVVWVVGEGRAAYYYAHLRDWRPGLRRGDRVRAGEPLGTVGNTGNARTTPSHLHFGVYRLSPLGRRGVDPVPLLGGGATISTRDVRARRGDELVPTLHRLEARRGG